MIVGDGKGGTSNQKSKLSPKELRETGNQDASAHKHQPMTEMEIDEFLAECDRKYGS